MFTCTITYTLVKVMNHGQLDSIETLSTTLRSVKCPENCPRTDL
jgi:hypothetical protein